LLSRLPPLLSDNKNTVLERMLAEDYQTSLSGYRIKLIIAIEKNGDLLYKNELIIPTFYQDIHEAQKHIHIDIEKRLKESFYFRSQKTGFDLVLYGDTGLSNTYLTYQIIPVMAESSRY